jgi:hypothetical protein
LGQQGLDLRAGILGELDLDARAGQVRQRRVLADALPVQLHRAITAGTLPSSRLPFASVFP